MSRLRFIIICFLAGFVIISGVLLFNARHLAGFKVGNLKDMLPTNVDMRLGNLFLSETNDKGRSLSIEAVTAQYFKDNDYFILSDVKADIGSTDSNFIVTAKNGRYEPNQNLIKLSGSVRTVDDKGRILTSEQLDLDMDKGFLTSTEKFCLEDPELNLSGNSFIYDTKHGILTVEGRIFMLINQNL